MVGNITPPPPEKPKIYTNPIIIIENIETGFPYFKTNSI
jgi:hypothetical protein